MSSKSEVTKEDKEKDKRVYKINDVTLHGSKIDAIYASAQHFILYRGEHGGLGWEFTTITEPMAELANEARRLLGIANSHLSKIRMKTVEALIAGHLANAFGNKAYVYNKRDFDDVQAFIDHYKNEIESTVASGLSFAIYRDNNGLIQWHHSKLTDPLRKQVEEFTTLQSLASNALPKSYRIQVSRSLSTSLANAFRNVSLDLDSDSFKEAREFIHAQIASFLKIRVFFITFTSTILLQLTLLIGYLIIGQAPEYFAGASAGVFGALVSSLQRNTQLKVNLLISKEAIYNESLSRMVIGILFGLFIIFCAKSQLALAPFQNNLYALVCFSFISGFSERFVPDLISTVSSKAEKDS